MRHNKTIIFRLLLLLLLTSLACQLTGTQTESQTAVPILAETAVPPTTLPQPPPTTSPEPTPPPTAVPTATDNPTSIPTATPAPTTTHTPIPWMEQSVIGQSVQNRPIEAIRLGTGDRWFVVLAAIHGALECHTGQLAEGIISRLTAEPTLLPPSATLFVVPLANPDGCALNTRYNANNVDLNRNWETDDWTADAEGPAGLIAGSGGASPFSEPETAALQTWLRLLRQQSPDGELRIISYHSAVPQTGLAQPAYIVYGQPEPRSDTLAQSYAAATGYRYSVLWVGSYTITGELIHWAGDNGYIAFDVELPDQNAADTVPNGRSETHIETNLRGLLAIMSQ